MVSVSIFPRVGSRGIPRSFGFCKQYGFSKLLAYHQVRHEYRIHDLALSYTLSYRLNETAQTVPPALQVRHLKVPSSEYETPSQVVVFPILERTILLGLKGIREILDCRLEKRYTFSETLSTPPSGVGRRGGKGFPFKIELSPSHPKISTSHRNSGWRTQPGDKRYLSYDQPYDIPGKCGVTLNARPTV